MDSDRRPLGARSLAVRIQVFCALFLLLGAVPAQAGWLARLCPPIVLDMAKRASWVKSEAPYAVIIDGYSSAVDFPDAIKKFKGRVIHIESAPNRHRGYLDDETWAQVAAQYERNIVYDGNLANLLRELLPYPLIMADAGTDVGIVLADQIRDARGLPTNGSATTDDRQDKYLMQEKLRPEHRIEQIRSHDREAIIKWARTRDRWPVVIKPRRGSGNDSVSIVDTYSFEAVLDQMLGSSTQMGLLNDLVVVQEFLEPADEDPDPAVDKSEFVFDSFSWNAEHFVLDAWRYHKRKVRRPGGGISLIYDYNEVLEADDPDMPGLEAFSRSVLWDHKIQTGVVHMEVKKTPKGFRLVETNCRVPGGRFPIVLRRARGFSPVEISAEAFFAPGLFWEHVGAPYRLEMGGRIVHLSTTLTGKVVAHRHLDEIRNLPSYIDEKITKIGGKIQFTVDINSRPGSFYLANKDRAQLKRDLDQVRRLGPDIFVVE